MVCDCTEKQRVLKTPIKFTVTWEANNLSIRK